MVGGLVEKEFGSALATYSPHNIQISARVSLLPFLKLETISACGKSIERVVRSQRATDSQKAFLFDVLSHRKDHARVQVALLCAATQLEKKHAQTGWKHESASQFARRTH